MIIPQKIIGDCRQTLFALPAGSHHMCVTSPPYWRLREYLPPGHPQKAFEIGTEETFELYVEHIVEAFRGVRHVLRDDGIMWVNMGDRYTNAGRSTYDVKAKMPSGNSSHPTAGLKRPADIPGLKKKELCMLPERVAMALQADGWFLRSKCPWIKRNCMPESVKDRPVTALEYLFMFSKSEDYFWDRYAVMVRASDNTHPRAAVFPHRHMRDDNNRRRRRTNPKAALAQIGTKQNPSFQEAMQYMTTRRNIRNTDWFMRSWQGLLTDDEGDPLAFVVNPKGTTIAHYASYPKELVKPCIEGGTSEKGCCPLCGAQLVRIIEQGEPLLEAQQACGGDANGDYFGQARKDYGGNKVQNASDVKRRILAGMVERKTVMWMTSCDCLGTVFTPDGQLPGGYHSVPCKVIDPFSGIGTTAEACLDLGRNYTGCEISETYLGLSSARDAQSALSLI